MIKKKKKSQRNNEKNVPEKCNSIKLKKVLYYKIV